MTGNFTTALSRSDMPGFHDHGLPGSAPAEHEPTSSSRLIALPIRCAPSHHDGQSSMTSLRPVSG